jgi:hypothetical protein
MHWNGGRAAVERGYNVLVFDGPGQYSAVQGQGLHFRPNWESVVTPVVDYALTRKEVDPKRIALHCESLGGYLAPRAAAFEHRLAACISDDGVYDLGTTMLGLLPPDIRTPHAARTTPGTLRFSSARVLALPLAGYLRQKARRLSLRSVTSEAGAIPVNAPTLEGWYLLQGPTVAISCPTGI